jgi:hypothetical protein
MIVLDEIKRNEARIVAYFRVLSWKSLGVTEETHKKSIRIVGVPSEIQTGHCPNVSRSDAEDAVRHVRPEMACSGMASVTDATEPTPFMRVFAYSAQVSIQQT